MEKPDAGRITRKGNKLYYHLFENTIGPMPLAGLKREQIDHVRMLATGAEIPWPQTASAPITRTLCSRTWGRTRFSPTRWTPCWKLP